VRLLITQLSPVTYYFLPFTSKQCPYQKDRIHYFS
jgi:hypothetical protein